MASAPELVEYRTAEEVSAGRFELLPIGALRESRMNPRKRYDASKMLDLVESVRRQGVITPLLVRPVQYLVGVGYEIAAGHRRKRAAEEAGLEYVPCIVREMDDRSFLEILTIENLQREDVHPLEEAEGFRELLGLPGYDTETVAHKIGKTPPYVHGRIALLDLVPVVREAFLADRITIGHARLIAGLDSKRQEEALGQCFWQEGWNSQRKTLRPAADLKRWIREDHGRDLARAPFEIVDSSLGAPACIVCAKAAGVNPLLVDPDGDKTCLDAVCYDEKVKTLIAKRTAAGVVAVSSSYSAKDTPPGALCGQEYVEIHTTPDDVDLDEIAELKRELAEATDEATRKKIEEQLEDRNEHETPCPHAEPAIVVHGYRAIGESKLICRNPECPVHGKQIAAPNSSDNSKEREKARKEAELRQMKERARTEARKEAMEAIIARGWLEGIDWDLCDMLVRSFLHGTNNKQTLTDLAKEVAAEFSKKGKNSYGGTDYDGMQRAIFNAYSQWTATEDEQRIAFMLRLFLLPHLERSEYHTGPDVLAEFASRCQVDLKALETFHLKALKANAKEKKTSKSSTPKAKKAADPEPERTTPGNSTSDHSTAPLKPDEIIEFNGPRKKGPAFADIRIWNRAEGLFLTVGISLPTKASEGLGTAGPLHVDGEIGSGDFDDPDFIWVNRMAALRTAYALIARFCRNDVAGSASSTDATRKAAKQVLAWVEEQVTDLEAN